MEQSVRHTDTYNRYDTIQHLRNIESIIPLPVLYTTAIFWLSKRWFYKPAFGDCSQLELKELCVGLQSLLKTSKLLKCCCSECSSPGDGFFVELRDWETCEGAGRCVGGWVAVACDHGWSSGAALVRSDPRYKLFQFLIPPTYHAAMISKCWVNNGWSLVLCHLLILCIYFSYILSQTPIAFQKERSKNIPMELPEAFWLL